MKKIIKVGKAIYLYNAPVYYSYGMLTLFYPDKLNNRTLNMTFEVNHN